MKSAFRVALAIAVALVAAPLVVAQSDPTATQLMNLSAFGAATGTHVGLAGGNNVGATAGVDLSVHLYRSFLPSVEVRGTLPFYGGNVASIKNALGGLKFERPYFTRYHPYADVLFGRAQIDYQNGGYPNPTFTYEYTKNPSNVLSLGGGVDVDITRALALKADIQWQRYSTPVTTSGHFNIEPISVGVVYRFNFNGHRYSTK